MKISVVGAGYVGLTTAAVFADLKNRVWVIRRNREKSEALKRGKIPFFEPGLERVVLRNIKKGHLIPTTNYSEAIPNSEVVFIAVGTPSGENGAADLSQVFTAAKSVAKNLSEGYTVVVIKSTVPPGTAQKVSEIIEKHKPRKAKFDVVSCPEFLREGSALRDTRHPDRIVIGGSSRKAVGIVKRLHKPLKAPFVVTDSSSAELIKYAANAFLATKISFINAISVLADYFGADIRKIADGVGADRRIGRSHLYAGIGYGGSCFPKDVKALIAIARKAGYNFELIKAVEKINKRQITRFVQKVKKALGGSLRGKTIAILGLAFKPETDDLREAPSLEIIQRLKRQGARIRTYDPVVPGTAKSAYDALRGADCLCLVTEWEEFKKLDFARAKKLMKQPIVVDGRNVYDRKKLEKFGFEYWGMGR